MTSELFALIPYFDQPTLEIPVFWRDAPITIFAFGAMVAVAVLVAGRRYENRLARRGCDPDRGYRMVVWMLVSGFLGAHLFDILFYHPQYLAADPWIALRIWEGLSSFGGIIGGLGGLLLFMVLMPDKEHGELPYFDAAAFSLPSGWFFGRIGCALAHDHPGVDTSFFLGIAYPPGTEKAAAGLGFHDLGLYEAIILLGMIVLFEVLDRKPRRTGFFVGWLALLYGLTRLGLDQLRVADTRYLGLTPAQFVAAVLVPVGLVHLAWTKRLAA